MKETIIIEEFKNIFGYEGLYQVSNLGNVKSLNYNKTKREKLLSTPVNNNGYCRVNLRNNNISKTFKVHQLVAISFLNHNKNSDVKLIVDHKNGKRNDNRLENLQLISQRYNTSKDKKNKTSKYTGVSWHKSTQKWIVSICINNKSYFLGRFNCELKAALVYQTKLKTL